MLAGRGKPERAIMSATSLVWSGRTLTAVFSLFLIFASVAPKLVGADVATRTMADLGWNPGYTRMIGVMELAFLLLHLWPRTSLLGAVLMTGLLGGAIATQLRVENPLLTHVLFGFYLGLFMWGGYWLRQPAFRTIFPID